MNRQTIRGDHNQIIGYLEIKNDENIVRDAHNAIAGRYSKAMDKTYDSHGKIVGQNGDILLTLVRQK